LLAPHGAHQEADLPHDRDAMPGLEALRRRVQDRVLDRPALERDERVDAARIGFQHRLGIGPQDCEIAPRGAGGIDLPRQDVAGERSRAEPFGVAPDAAPEQGLHLPQPVLRMDKAERREDVGHCRRLDVRNSVGIAKDADLGGEPAQRGVGRQVRQMLRGVECGGRRGHGCPWSGRFGPF
jgi:hypothetical protein